MYHHNVITNHVASDISTHGLLYNTEITGCYLLGFFLEFFDGTLVDTTAFIDQMTRSSRLARVDMSDDDNVDVYLLLTHFFDLRIVPLMFWGQKIQHRVSVLAKENSDVFHLFHICNNLTRASKTIRLSVPRSIDNRDTQYGTERCLEQPRFREELPRGTGFRPAV